MVGAVVDFFVVSVDAFFGFRVVWRFAGLCCAVVMAPSDFVLDVDGLAGIAGVTAVAAFLDCTLADLRGLRVAVLVVSCDTVVATFDAGC